MITYKNLSFKQPRVKIKQKPKTQPSRFARTVAEYEKFYTDLGEVHEPRQCPRADYYDPENPNVCERKRCPKYCDPTIGSAYHKTKALLIKQGVENPTPEKIYGLIFGAMSHNLETKLAEIRRKQKAA
ncbi:MAG: hypothetical protein FWD15_03470 [Alphaproteobacteria bacterium]|nr:hypothetical protein [Alphaproteobacteria bacterium]